MQRRRLLSSSVERAKQKCLVQESNPHGWLRRPLPSPLDERDISAQMDSNHQRKDLQSRLVPDRAHMSGQCSSRTNLFPGFNRTPLPVSQLPILFVCSCRQDHPNGSRTRISTLRLWRPEPLVRWGVNGPPGIRTLISQIKGLVYYIRCTSNP